MDTPRPMPRRVVISGASGLIGRALAARLAEDGLEVVPLVRRPAGPGEIRWDPVDGVLDTAACEGCEAVVHLAGANIGAGRWTAARKAEIMGSRVEGTRLLAGVLARLREPPPVLVVASAVGYYGDRPGEIPMTEAEGPGIGFLSEVCRAWEAAAAPALLAGIRTVHMRTGVVLSAEDGALARMLPPFRLGLGGPIGDGGQVMSWIALPDVVAAYRRALRDPQLSGPVNATAPGAVSSAEFARTLGAVLGRPALVPLPAIAVELAFGEMGRSLLLEGARVVPAKLQAAGFKFAYPELDGALRHALGQAPALV